MDFKSINPDKAISLFVKDILVFDEPNKVQETILPFFADGYPGIMFQETEKGLVVMPYEKEMPSFILYGQTIHPIELLMKGSYKLIIFKLYPFVLKSFFNITAKDFNDNCYDLLQVENGINVVNELQSNCDTDARIEIISNFLVEKFITKKETLDLQIRDAIQMIIDNKGQTVIGEISGKVSMTERTFERRFLKEVGILPKQFSKIIQFQESLQQLTLKEYSKLNDLVYGNGFADQSHFIRIFKTFTGKTPKEFAVK
ncbi:helix-turn-helix domain-containing protein [Flavobacterium aestivum]|uniref:helix-turn-helix domain-containing protein n=1 Tax=Flavobacterium aestivum TaxID=3003257 RepID=UPI002286CCAB|nr:AraC family transcriptional regulator [Flavobacterium aestivum]